MPIKETNNDQNINRGLTKMSEECPNQNNEKLTDSVENKNCLRKVNCSDNKDNLNDCCDHMYTSNSDTKNIDVIDYNCQNTESEVKFLKEWLLLHLDFIQQQNNEILNKEKTILILKRENAMLKERINCLDQGQSFQTNKLNNYISCDCICENSLDKMTQDAAHIDEDNKQNTYFVESLNSDKSCIEMQNYDVNRQQLVTHNNTNAVKRSDPQNVSNCLLEFPVHIKNEEGAALDIRQDINNPANNSLLNLNTNNFLISSSVEDTLKNLKMSIRRKRLCSSSSALSNNDPSIEEPRSSRKKKKRKCRKDSIKDDKILTCNDQYLTQSGEIITRLPVKSETPNSIPSATNLEVPRWRIKVYTSCYTMEGTENLDDEVYNKRHMRLENDERRRKRWDVQRIREQRIVEKLKQRQDRVGSGSRSDEQSEPVLSLRPTLEDIKYLEVCDQLPVSAFGAPIPKFTPSEFSLPWLNNTNEILKKPSSRKSTIRRKATKR